MKNELAIVSYKGITIAAFFKSGELFEVFASEPEKKQLLSNIYIGKVKHIVKNIRAAFVEIENKTMCYLPLKEEADAVFTSPKSTAKIVEGDEILVQVVKEAVKSKEPMLTTKLSIAGRFAVLTKGKTQLSVSSKISSAEVRERLTKLAEAFVSEEYGWIIRTNAAEATDEEIIQDMRQLSELFDGLMKYGVHRTYGTCLFRNPDELLLYARNHMNEKLDRIITDLPEVYNGLTGLFRENPSELEKIRWYEDESYPLIKLLGLESKLKKAFNKKVWLKSGGSLVIEPTEALTSIDVNTEKAVQGNRNPESTFLKINKEAAVEICRQLQIRNLSGIIIVDFIDMKEKKNKEELLSFMRKLLKEDPVKTMLIDMTPLGLVEITRMKVRKPLHEVFAYTKNKFVDIDNRL